MSRYTVSLNAERESEEEDPAEGSFTKHSSNAIHSMAVVLFCCLSGYVCRHIFFWIHHHFDSLRNVAQVRSSQLRRVANVGGGFIYSMPFEEGVTTNKNFLVGKLKNGAIVAQLFFTGRFNKEELSLREIRP